MSSPSKMANCKLCGKLFKTEFGAKMHMAQFCAMRDKDSKSFKALCGAVFTSQRLANAHMRTCKECMA